MTRDRIAHPVSGGQRAASIARVGFAGVLAMAGAGCSASVQDTGTAGSGGRTGPNGSGGAIPLATGSGAAGTSGTGGCKGADPLRCKAKVPEGCGDGINNQNGMEECDDGNTLPGDGCNGACKVEPNWKCPADVRSGPCTRKNICGDGTVGPGEVCDDGNAVDNDGCNSTCTVQDPAYQCTPGQLCVRISQCGNRRIEPGENCDDGNNTSGDGCSSSCQLEAGWVCPRPGTACKPAPRCGDGVLNASLGEVCDDGNTKDGDGCSADCKTKGAGCVCATPGQPCKCPTVKCGNGTIEGSEQCDDGNTRSGDGCSTTCQIERGYACPFTNAPCVPDCGDGMVLAPFEQCDPKAPGTNMNQACSNTCKYNPGWACTDNPPSCHKTTCGDGKVEGSEGCDDGNTLPNDGCSPTCHYEPDCSAATGQCKSKCGDGIVVNEECDDGNLNDGDGCSSTCKVEVDAGYQCSQPGSNADTMGVPVTYRDFLIGGDFYKNDIPGSNAAIPGLVQGTLDSDGKPVLAGTAGAGHITSADTFKQWYRDVPGTNTTFVSSLLLHNNGKGGFVNWWKDNQEWVMYTNPQWCGNPDCSDGCNGIYSGAANQVCLAVCTPWGIDNTNHCVVDAANVEGNPLFFPLDNVPGMITPTSAYVLAQTPPLYSTNWAYEPGKPVHNFSFTSEVRYWFNYSTAKQYTLDFTGDDDVWVFVNRKLAVDLGGIHTPVDGRLVLNASGGGSVTITPTEGSACKTQGDVSTCTSTQSTVTLGMTNGGVYEIALFQAERCWYGSTYKLTLSGFNDQASACGPICGNGIVQPGEQCDNGTAQNLGGYNQCTSSCTLGPYCGDGKVDAGGKEECDNGRNQDDYGASSGCAPGCKLPARCGDGIVQTQFDEECDDGSKNLTTKDPNAGYNGCLANCKRGGYCGDGGKNGQEECDDGVNDGTYGNCGVGCVAGPRCGDGIVQADYGEECEPKMSDDPECTNGCHKPAGCGDGKIEPPEQCDDGALFNKGEYGGCAPSCIYAPRCGDGIKNGPEECDDGKLDNSYGGCNRLCRLGPHCGDGFITEDREECDDGDQNGIDGNCTTSCKLITYVYQ